MADERKEERERELERELARKQGLADKLQQAAMSIASAEKPQLAKVGSTLPAVAPAPPPAPARLAERLLLGECAPEAAYEAEGKKLTNQDIAYMLAVLASRGRELDA